MSLDLAGITDYFNQAAVADVASTGTVSSAISSALAAFGFSNPYTAFGEIGFQLLEKLLGIPDPLQLLLGLFSGRPTMQATIDISDQLRRYSSPPLMLMAMGAAALVKADIPISSPQAGPIFGKCFAAAVWLEQAIRWRNFTTALGQLEAHTLTVCLHEAGNPGTTGNPTLIAVQQAWTQYPSKDHCLDAMRAIAGWTYADPGHLMATNFAKAWLKTQPSRDALCPPAGIPGPQPIPDTTEAEPSDDEIIDLQSNVASGLAAIAQALALLKPPSTEGETACCEQIFAVLISIATAVSTIATTPSDPALETQLHNIREELDCVCTAVQALTPATASSSAGIADAVNNVATAISAAKPTDVAGIVEQLKQIVGQGDVDQAIFNALQQQGLLSGADLQTLQGIKWSDALSYLTSVSDPRTLEHFVHEMGDDAPAIANYVKTKLGAGANWAEKIVTGALKMERNAIQDALEIPLKAIISALKPGGPVSIGSIGVNPDTVLADVAAVGFNIWAILALVGLKFPGTAEQLEKITEAVVGVLGFEELEEVQIGPLVRHGIAKVADLQAKATFRQEIIGASSAYSLAARGIITRQVADYLAALNGLPKELETAEASAAESGLNPRQMLRLIETGLFSDADIHDELIFAGMRPASQARMLRAAPYLATASERSQLRGEIEKAYVFGFYTDQNVADQLDSAEHNVDRTALILDRLHIETRITAAKDLEAEYSTLYLAGLIDDPTYRANLAGLGLQDWRVSTLMARSESRAAATLARQEAAAARALARATAAEERKVAMRNFLQGTINAAGLAAALVLTGLTPIQTAAYVDMAELEKTGSARWLYGLRLTPDQAALMRDRIRALTDQFKKQEITQTAFTDALHALGLDAKYVNGLLAAAAAMRTGKGAAYLVPVQTS